MKSDVVTPVGPPLAPSPETIEPSTALPDPAPEGIGMTDRPAPDSTPGTDVPGSADGTQSILLRRRTDAAAWDRLTGQSSLTAGDLLLSLEPFRTPVQIGPHSVEMIDQAEIRLLGPADDGTRVGSSSVGRSWSVPGKRDVPSS